VNRLGQPPLFSTVNGDKWKTIGVSRRAGVLAPLFSLRTRSSTGIGGILDLERLVDWCAKTRLSIIQLLPINDTATDPSPYGSCSAFALNPVYLSLNDPAFDAILPQSDRSAIRMDLADRVDYPRVRHTKLDLLRRAFLTARSDLGHNRSFADFQQRTSFWLPAYSAFMALKDAHDQRSWNDWGNWAVSSPETIDRAIRTFPDQTLFYQWIQWHLDRQMIRARGYAAAHGVLLKGDLPFLLNEDSADVWACPRFFNTSVAAGCPPDYYNADGQYWGFPTYRWDELARDEYGWWGERLRHAESYYDLFRIDHVLGFFRIWTIPVGDTAVFGQFVPAIGVTPETLRDTGVRPDEVSELVRRKILLPMLNASGAHAYAFKWKFHTDPDAQSLGGGLKHKLWKLESFFSENDEIQNDLWMNQGKDKLTAISRLTRMLVCAEDLGTVPPCVRPCLRDLGITQLVVDRWSKFIPTNREKKEGKREYWIEPWDWEPVSVASPSNHDMSTLRGWWLELSWNDRADQLRRWGWRGNPPESLDENAVQFILKRNLDSQSIFTILALRDWLDLNPRWLSPDPAADRINLPGTVSQKNWNTRMPVLLEELIDSEDFNRRIAEMVRAAGRSGQFDG